MTDPWERRWVAPAAFILLWIIVAAVYARVIPGDWVFDDVAIWADPVRRLETFSWEGLWRATSRVESERARWIPNATFALNYLWFGIGTRSFHVANIVIHALASLALFAFIRETLRLDGRAEGTAVRIAILTAALFALNPVHTQAVSYIWQRAASLAGLFVFATLWLLASGLRRRGGRRALLLGASCVLGFTSVFVKQNAIVLAAVMPIYVWFFASRRSFRGLAIAGGVLAVSGFIALAVITPYVWPSSTPLEAVARELGGSPEKFGARLMTQSRVVLHLASLVLAPNPARLSIDHHVISSHGLADPWTTAPAIATVAILAAAALGLARRRPLVSFCIVYYFVTLAPEVVIVRLVPMFEHRAYIPSAGPLLLAALAIDWLGSGPLRQPRIAGAVAGAVLMLFAAGTWSRNAVWTSQLALSEDAARKAPLHPRPHWNVGASWEAEGRRLPPRTAPHEDAWDRAEAAYRRAHELDRNNLQFQDTLARFLAERGRGGSAADIPVWLILSSDDRRLYEEFREMYDPHDAALAEALDSWTRGRARRAGAPDLPTSAALRLSGARAFWVSTRLRRLSYRSEGGRVHVTCGFLVEIYDWRGTDLGRRNRHIGVTGSGKSVAPDGESGRRDAELACIRAATEALVTRRLTETLGRLAWFQDRMQRESAKR